MLNTQAVKRTCITLSCLIADLIAELPLTRWLHCPRFASSNLCSHLDSKGSKAHDSVSTGKVTASLRNKRKREGKGKKEKSEYYNSSQSRALSAHTWLSFGWHVPIYLAIQVITSKNVRKKVSHLGPKPEIMCVSFDHSLRGLGKDCYNLGAILCSALEALFSNVAFDHIFKT